MVHFGCGEDRDRGYVRLSIGFDDHSQAVGTKLIDLKNKLKEKVKRYQFPLPKKVAGIIKQLEYVKFPISRTLCREFCTNINRCEERT